MKEIVIISGKGGTGKTSVTAAFARLAGKDAILADCDVDASNLHLIMHPHKVSREEFYSGVLAIIDPKLCIGCDKCRQVCRFDAILHNNLIYSVDSIRCEGCGYCEKVCPVNAIQMLPQLSGEVFISETNISAGMVHAALGIGAENSGKLVAKVKQEAKRIAEETGKPLILADGSPGIGCPVVSSLSGAGFVVIVTEPSVSGYHDLERVIALIHTFQLPAGCIINKADINPETAMQIRHYLQNEGILHLADIPYHDDFSKAVKQGKSVMEMDNPLIETAIKTAWGKVLKEIIEKKNTQ